ncbi:MAG: post-COAP-1 domain-containing protein [Planctomycetota bacterium]|jgi:hypothetical protein
MYWDQSKGAYHLKLTDCGDQYTFVEIPYLSSASYKLEFDIRVVRLDWAATVLFGLGDSDMHPYEPATWGANYGRGDGGNGATVHYFGDSSSGRFPGGYDFLFEFNTDYHNVIVYDRNTESLSWQVTRISDGAIVADYSASAVGSFTGIDRLYSGRVGYCYAPGATGEAYIDNVVLCAAQPELPCWQEQAKLLASDGAGGDYFGVRVSIEGDHAIVGADWDDDNGSGSGSAYVFKRDGETWTEQAKLVASDGAAGDHFGAGSVSISGDYAIVAAIWDDSRSGSAYIFKRNPDESWTEQAKLTASDGAAYDQFGYSVSISGDYAFAGAYAGDGSQVDSGCVYVFRRDGQSWIEQAKLTASDGAAGDRFGRLSVTGDYVIVGAEFDDDKGTNSGSAYVFKMPDAGWADATETAKLTASDGAGGDAFGCIVSISGDYAIVGAYAGDGGEADSGAAYVFKRNGESWTEQAKLTGSDGQAGDQFGYSLSISGEYVIVGAHEDDDRGTNSGSAYIYKRSGDTWDEVSKLLASDGAAYDYLGISVGISGGYTIIGSYYDDDSGTNSGSAYIFQNICVPEPPCWQEEAKLTASDGAAYDHFGSPLSIAGDYAIVGSHSDDDNGADSGSAYIFKRQGDNWIEHAKLAASDGGAGDRFGWSTCTDGIYAVVGSRDDDDNGVNSGSVYMFKREADDWTEKAKLTASDGEAGDNFGYFTSTSGSYVLVGAYHDDDKGTDSGSAYIFEREGETWVEKAKLTASDGQAGDSFGYVVSISGDYAIVGAYQDDDKGTDSGSAYILKRTGEGWTEQVKLTAADGAAYDCFGNCVSISGDYAVVGSYNDNASGLSGSGSVYIFKRQGESWTNLAKLTASDAHVNDHYGKFVCLDGDTLIVGVPYDDVNGLPNSGSAYVLQRDGEDWIEVAKLVAADAAAYDYFGEAASISGNYAVAGAHWDDEQGDGSGSAYVFKNICNTEPSADAGEDQEVATGPEGTAQVILDCSDSNDPEGDQLTYAWFIDGNEVAAGVNPTIVLPCGNYTIELIVNDGQYDSEPDYVDITVVDGTPPVITCPDNVTLECPADIDPSAIGSATAADNCDEAPAITYSDTSSGTCPQVIQRTWTATDATGNTTSCVQIVTVQDTTPPVFTTTPLDETVQRDGNGNTEQLNTWLAQFVQAIDTCGGVSVNNDYTSFPYQCGNTGSLTVTWTAADDSGNEATSAATFTIEDPTAAVTYDGDMLLSTAGNPTINANLVATLRDADGDPLDIDGENVTFTLTADGVGTIVLDANSQDGAAQVVQPLEPAIYMIKVTLGCSDYTASAILVVFNPEGGFATGGGWILPVNDGLNTHPDVRANFGFNAKYKQDDPTGHLEFRYSDGFIDLKSTSIDQLVITGGKIVQFKGWASVNGQQGHWFFVKAIDNGEPGTNNDTFEIKTWAPGVDPEGDPSDRAGGVLQGGNIVVHTK